MDEIDNLINQIIETLNQELPDQYQEYAKDFELLTGQDLLRASYDILDRLKRKQDWHPSVKLIGLIDRYKVVF
jgi:hypothetical protein